MEKKKASITLEQMLADGWVKTEDLQFPFEKQLENRNPINNTPEDTDIKLVVHGMYNELTFAVLFPDGGMLNFVANTIKELQQFENKIAFYDPPF